MSRVLMVDDEPLVRHGVAAGMDWASLGCEVVGEAQSGEEGLALARRLKPDLIITDIRMPKMDGITMMNMLREEGCAARCIVLTAHSDFEYARGALLFGADDYLLKPVQAGELSASLLRAMQAIEQQQKNKHTIVQLRNYLDASRPYIRELFFAYIKTFPYAESEQFPLYQIFEIPPQTELFLPLHIAFPGVESLFDPAAFETNDSLFHLVDCSLTAQELPHLARAAKKFAGAPPGWAFIVG